MVLGSKVGPAGPGMGLRRRELFPLQVLIVEVFLATRGTGLRNPDLRGMWTVCVGRGAKVTQRRFEQRLGNSGAFDSPRS